MKSFKITISKNVTDYTAFGSTSPTSLHNQRFDVKGDFTLLYNETTQRQYLANSTKRALRLALVNAGATAISGSSYPTIQLDMPVCTFTSFDVTDANDTLREQTLGFTAEFDPTRSLTLEALMLNTRLTTY